MVVITQVRNMVLRCPDLLLNDVRNVVVPLLEYVLRCTWDHSELGKRLYKDPTLLAVSPELPTCTTKRGRV